MENQPPKTDTLYQSYNRGFFKITGSETLDTVMDIMQADPSANNSTAVQVGVETIGSGTATGVTSQSVGNLMGGKQTFADVAPGYFIGIVNNQGVFSFGGTGNSITFDGATLTITGSVSAGSINIPDATTASSFHVDSSGNSWWGANVASGYAAANAYVLATGQAVFKNVAMGGTVIQYTITNNGIFSFGDGSDGAGVADGSTSLAGASLAGSIYTLTRDVYYTDLTISTGVTIKPSGYRIFGTGTLTFTGTAAITGNGIAGSAGANGTSGASTGGAGGGALADGYLKGSAAGGTGGNGGNSAGTPATVGADGTAVTNSIGSSGVAGGNGGAGNGGAGANAGAAGTATASNVKLIANWHLATLLDVSSSGSTVKFNNSGGASGGGGGQYQSTNSPGGAGGGGGSAGRILAVYFRNIVGSGTGMISANGGAGGAGGNGVTVSAGGGGGGGGGNGGQVILVYNTFTTNSMSITATAGLGGAAGAAGSFTPQAQAGSNGTAGNIRQFQISL